MNEYPAQLKELRVVVENHLQLPNKKVVVPGRHVYQLAK
jgi:hypothetical protein